MTDDVPSNPPPGATYGPEDATEAATDTPPDTTEDTDA
jgi:hypothetical protein